MAGYCFGVANSEAHSFLSGGQLQKETDGGGLNGNGLPSTQEGSFEKQLVRLLLQTPRQDKIQYTKAVSASLESLNRNH